MTISPLISRYAAWVAALLVAVPVAAQKAPPSLNPGDYMTERGWGSLTLKLGTHGALAFSIEAIGSNAHICSLEGELRNGKATLEAMEENDPCVVTMVPTAAGIEVKGSASGSCRSYCGMRATFEGLYLKPPPACTSKAVAATRKSFKQLYDARKFAAARAKLEPILKDCSRMLYWLEDGRIRNDVAVTLHKLGDLSGCRAVLEPLAEDAAATDEQVRDGYPPTDADNYLPIVRATRTNLKLCREQEGAPAPGSRVAPQSGTSTCWPWLFTPTFSHQSGPNRLVGFPRHLRVVTGLPARSTTRPCFSMVSPFGLHFPMMPV